MARLSWIGQLRAIGWLRLRVWRNALSTDAGLANAVGGGLMAILASVLSLALAGVVWVVVGLAAESGDREALRTAYAGLFWLLVVLAIALPLFTGQGTAGEFLKRLRAYPLDRRRVFALSLAGTATGGSGLFWYPAWAAMVLRSGATGPLVALPALLLLALSLVAWGHALLLALETALRRRAARELAALVAFFALVSLSALPALIQAGTRHGSPHGWIAALRPPAWLGLLLAPLPPTLGARALAEPVVGAGAVLAVAGLAAWAAAGLWAGYALLGRVLEPSSGDRPRASGQDADHGQRVDLARWLPAPLAAMVEKELLYLVRSAVGRLNLALAPVLAAIVSVAFGDAVTDPRWGLDQGELLFLGLMAYSSMLLSNLLSNTFAWEGGGLRACFLAPIEPRWVMLGKNLGVWLFALLPLALTIGTWSLLAAPPRPFVLLLGGLVYAFCLLALTLAGNLTSLLFPAARPIAAMGGAPPAPAVLASFVSLGAGVGVGVGALSIGHRLGSPAAQAGLLALAVVLELGLYRLEYAVLGRMLIARREPLLAAVGRGA